MGLVERRDRVVVLTDRPYETQKGKCERSKQVYPYLFEASQVFELPHCSFAECYPTPFAKTAAEVKVLGKQKVAYAREVGAKITKEQFELEMAQLAAALKRCVELAFGPF